MTTRTARQAPSVIDGRRAAMLQGDALRSLGDGDREWIMRSLLKGVRRHQAVHLSGLDDAQVERALVRVKRWYDQRLDAYQRQQERERQHPKVVRAVAPAAAPRRGWWSFQGK